MFLVTVIALKGTLTFETNMHRTDSSTLSLHSRIEEEKKIEDYLQIDDFIFIRVSTRLRRANFRLISSQVSKSEHRLAPSRSKYCGK